MDLGNVVFFGDLVDERYDPYIIEHTKNGVPFSAINYNRKIINELMNRKSVKKLTLVCRSGVGAYPRYSDLKVVPEMTVFNGTTIRHNNIFGFRILSEKKEFKKRIKKIVFCDIIIVSGLHSPYLSAAVKLKEKTNAKLIVIVNDMPEFMQFSKASFIYKFLKKIDRKSINDNLLKTDGFVFISEAINNAVNKKNVPYVVIEGIIDNITFHPPVVSKKIFYTGTLAFAFDIENMVESFVAANLKMNNSLELNICGDGDAKDYILAMSASNNNIKYLGVKSLEEIKLLSLDAQAFINPRKNTHEYTKYSYPSKNLDYLKTCKPVIGYKFSSAQKKINELIFSPEYDEVNLSEAIIRVMNMKKNDLIEYQKKVKETMLMYTAVSYVSLLEKLIIMLESRL